MVLDLLFVSEILLAVLVVRFGVVAFNYGVFAAEMGAELGSLVHLDHLAILVLVVAFVVAFLLSALIMRFVTPIAIILLAPRLFTHISALLDLAPNLVRFLTLLLAALVKRITTLSHLFKTFLLRSNS